MTGLHHQLLDWINTAERAVAEDSYSTGILLAAALRAVVELHAPERLLGVETGQPVCCVEDGEKCPCDTVRVIAEQLGVETE